jgi:hypothetical protein
VTGANFSGAQLEGASFADTRGVPPELEPFLDAARRYTSMAPAPPPAQHPLGRPAVFFSLPSGHTPSQEALCDRLAILLRREGLTVERLTPNDYPPSDALSEIYRRLAGCSGAVVFGMRPADAAKEEPSPGVTPWTHLEAGMAFGCNLPLLIVREPGVDSGAFDNSVAGHRTYILDLVDRWEDGVVVRAIRPWLSELVRS